MAEEEEIDYVIIELGNILKNTKEKEEELRRCIKSKDRRIV